MANERLRESIRAAGLSVEELARRVHVDPKTAQRWITRGSTPHPETLIAAARVLGADPDELWPPQPPAPADMAEALDTTWTRVQAPDPNGLEAIELMRRVEASDAGPTTIEALGRGVDRLCRAYTHTPPEHLLVPALAYQRYIGRLLDGRVTLRQRQELISQAGWLSLLIGTTYVDLGRRQAAEVNLAAAGTLAREIGDEALVGWIAETEGWWAITEGRYRQAVEVCEAGLDHAPADTSAEVQLTIQLARSNARLGNARETYRLIDEATATLDRMPPPVHPEHHYVFDPGRLIAYSAAALVWLADDDNLAEEYARQAVAQYDSPTPDGRWVRRLALARVDLGLVLARSGQPEEAVQLGELGLEAGRLVGSDVFQATDLDHALVSRYPDLPDVVSFHEHYRELVAATREPAALNAPERPEVS